MFKTGAPIEGMLFEYHWKFILFYGLVLLLFNTMWTFSVEYNSTSVATMLAFCSPAIIALLGRQLHNGGINHIKLASMLYLGQEMGDEFVTIGSMLALFSSFLFILIGIFCTYQGVVNAMRALSNKPVHYALSIPFVK